MPDFGLAGVGALAVAAGLSACGGQNADVGAGCGVPCERAAEPERLIVGVGQNRQKAGCGLHRVSTNVRQALQRRPSGI